MILKYYNTAKCRNDYNYDYELRWTTNHHNSAVLRLERAPASMCPSPNRPRYQTCVWMDPLCTNVWTQRWGARFISSNETPPHAGRSPLPLVGGARSPAARVRMLRESGRMSRVCLAACVNWECARLGENACRDEEKWKNNQQQQKRYKNIWREKKIATMRFAKVSGRNSAFERLICEIPERRNCGYEKTIVVTRILFLIY